MSGLSFKILPTAILISAGLVTGPQIAVADSISGTLNIAGSISLSSADGLTISFDPISGGSPFTFVVIPSTGSFSTLLLDEGSESTSLTGVAEPINTVLATPLAGFLSIPSASLTFDLTEVLGSSTAGSTPCTLGTTTGSCYLAGSAFNLNTGSGGTSATFSVEGNLNYQGLTADNVVLQYSLTFENENIAQVLDALLTTGNPLVSSDGQVTVNVAGTTTTPEPNDVSMILAGIGFGGMIVFKRKRAVSQ